jgi:GNAT superfamily N-acetyltransferase
LKTRRGLRFFQSTIINQKSTMPDSSISFPYAIREATPDDIPEILRQRRAMYEDMDYTDPEALSAMVSASGPYLFQAMSDGTFRAWLALLEERVVGGGAIVISPWPSHPYDPQCRRATILNMYTYRDHRRKGIARGLMQAMIDWCRREGLASVALHASQDGRPLYEALGFEPTNEMRLKLG